MKHLIKRAVFLSILFGSISADAGVYEIGSSFAFQRSNYNSGSYNWTRTWTGSFGYYLTQDSEIAFQYSDSITKTYVQGIQDITYRDRTYSINMLYHFFEEEDRFRPFIRGGLGQLNRDAAGVYASGAAPPGRLDQVTVIAGVGLKAKVVSRLGVKLEVTSFMAGGNLSTWQDNISINFGGAFYF